MGRYVFNCRLVIEIVDSVEIDHNKVVSKDNADTSRTERIGICMWSLQ